MKASECRVLVVDDNVDNADSVAMVLQCADFAVRTEYDGPRGLSALLEFRPQAALLDIGLPGISGYEIARQARARLGPSVLLIAVTGWGSAEDVQNAKQAGFDMHFTKPADASELARIIERECVNQF